MDSAALARLKAYLHIDHDEDDTLLTSLYASAAAYLANAGIPSGTSPLYEQAAFGLVLEWYDDGATSGAITVGLRQIINQLKLTVSNLDTVL